MKYIFFIIFVTTAVLLSGQNNMTLNQAISIGLENNFGLRISDKAIEIAETNNTWARAGKTPTVDLRGSFTNQLTRDNNPASFLQGTYYNGSLSVTADANWILYNGGRIKLDKEQLDLNVDQQKLNKQTDINLLLRNIYQQYYEVIFQAEQLVVLNQVLALSQDRVAYEKAKKEYGASNSYNILQFESGLLADTNAIITQIQQVETAKRNLYTTLNIAGYKDYTFDERLSIIPEVINSEELKNSLSEDNYTIKSLEMIAALNRLNTGIAQSATKPVFSINGSIGFAENGFKFFGENEQTGESLPFLDSNRFTGGLNAVITYNLYDGGVRNDNIQTAKLQEELDQLSIEEAKVELNNQLDILIDNYENQIELLNITDRQIKVAQQNLEITEERFKAGQLTSLDYRNVQTQYLNAAYSKVGAIYALLITKSEIDFLVGVFKE